ncbi:MAG TPA: bifunctional demethylmenaquinone methyltransferase/2-methoxy-6-polyprenyl-1,4-benzoquinol methylase UbiE [Polyangiaceae bacterium]|nr:bifunctional demethylmenaquinone methyltransferase/2-methoxy-6-polyprenyl-1,4-benzoquinol methylase UbiE [Polyangiaceae bacterium]
MTTNDMSLQNPNAARQGSGRMFDAIAGRYDLLNRVLSFGMDQSWRRKTARALNLGSKARVLDLATGTADLALQVVREAPDCHVVGLDPSINMLEVGRRKVAELGLSGSIELLEGDAQQLPFGDAEFDGVCIAFGIRNVPDRSRALREMARVTRPNGRIAILELSEPEGGLLGAIARFHVHSVVPHLGALLSGASEYRYLQRSIAAFPPAREFQQVISDAGIEPLELIPLRFGVCHLYVGKPRALA